MSADNDKPNLASLRPARRPESRPGTSSPEPPPQELRFSAAELEAIWESAMADAGQRSNEDFRRAFETALRTRAMRKLHLFGAGGLELKMATGQNWGQESWVARETSDGGLVVRRK